MAIKIKSPTFDDTKANPMNKRPLELLPLQVCAGKFIGFPNAFRAHSLARAHTHTHCIVIQRANAYSINLYESSIYCMNFFSRRFDSVAILPFFCVCRRRKTTYRFDNSSLNNLSVAHKCVDNRIHNVIRLFFFFLSRFVRKSNKNPFYFF